MMHLGMDLKIPSIIFIVASAKWKAVNPHMQGNCNRSNRIIEIKPTGYINKGRSLIVLFISVICMLCQEGCCKPPMVPDAFIVDSIVADLTYEWEWMEDNCVYIDRIIPVGTMNDDRFSDSDRQNLREMISNNFTFQSIYKGCKATIVANILGTGAKQWVNSLLYNTPEDYPLSEYHTELMQNYRLCFLYKDHRWYFVPENRQDWSDIKSG
jgi:hypothetical protein